MKYLVLFGLVSGCSSSVTLDGIWQFDVTGDIQGTGGCGSGMLSGSGQVQITGDVADLDDIFYLGKPAQFMVDSTWVLLVGFSLLTLGYLATPMRAVPLKARIFRIDLYDPKRLRYALLVMLLTSLVALVAFIRLTFTSVVDLTLEMLSKHRGVSQDLDEYHAYGYLRLLIGLSSVVSYIAYVRLKTSELDRNYYRVLFVLGLLVALLMAFYSQSRAALILSILNFVFIKYYLEKHRFPWKIFLAAAPVVTVLFVLVSGLRGGSGVDLTRQFTPMTAIAPIVLNIGGIDASKTGHVIDFIDETQDYKFGQTLVQFIWAAVPREIWPDKPPNLDTYVGENIYGANVYGAAAVPPGLFAEMYMNYWYGGIVLGSLLLGVFLKQLQNVLTTNEHNANFILLYVTSLQTVGFGILASGVSSTIIGSLMTGIPLLVALSYVTVRPERLPASAPAHA